MSNSSFFFFFDFLFIFGLGQRIHQLLLLEFTIAEFFLSFSNVLASIGMSLSPNCISEICLNQDDYLPQPCTT